jgi:hypothetical protein
MNTKLTITLALAAGFLGGLASRDFGPAPVYAQAPAVPQEIRAHKFVLIDDAGVARGVFGMESNGYPQIEVYQPKGRRGFVAVYQAVGWSAVHGIFAGGLPGPKRPTLLPIKP